MAIRPPVDHDEASPKEIAPMSRDVIKSQWTRLQGKMRAKWSKLTHDDVIYGEGDRAYLTGRLQERYGLSASAAALQVANFERMLY